MRSDELSPAEVRTFLRGNMHTIDEVYLDHEAHERDGIFYCRCGARSNQQEWEQHVADKIADKITGRPAIQLPLVG